MRLAWSATRRQVGSVPVRPPKPFRPPNQWTSSRHRMLFTGTVRAGSSPARSQSRSTFQTYRDPSMGPNVQVAIAYLPTDAGKDREVGRRHSHDDGGRPRGYPFVTMNGAGWPGGSGCGLKPLITPGGTKP